MSDTALILLAAGSSSRMGQPKQLLNYCGKPLIRHAVEIALQSACRPVFVIIGANAAFIRPTLENTQTVVIENELWETGIGSSIRRGVDAAAAHGSKGVILALADQPHVTSAILDRLIIGSGEAKKQIVASQYSGTLGVPAYFSHRYFSDLVALQPAEGCKRVILSHLPDCLRIDCPEAASDIDTPADWDRLQQT